MGREGALTPIMHCRRLHSMISGAWAACCKKRKASCGQNRKVNGHMCPIGHLQTSYRFLQHLEGPSSSCTFCLKVADLVCWALRTHRTACNTAKPVKSCAPFTYHSHVFTSFIIACFHSHLSISYVGKSKKFRTKTRQFLQAPSKPCASSSAHRLTGRPVNPSLGHRDTPSHDHDVIHMMWCQCDLNVIHDVPLTFLSTYGHLSNPVESYGPIDGSLFEFRLSPVTTDKFEGRKSLPCTCATYTPGGLRMEIVEANMPLTW